MKRDSWTFVFYDGGANFNTVNNYQTEIFFAAGVEAEARRMRALPLIAQEPTRRLDHNWSGPDLPLDEMVRRRFFGEE